MSKFQVPKINELVGRLLIAAPYLKGSCFDHSVVFINNVTDTHVIGTIVNHPIGKQLGSLSSHLEVNNELNEVPIFHGGPVDENKIRLAVIKSQNGQITNITFNITHPEAIDYISTADSELRAYIGLSCWSPEQLRRELQDRAWYVLPPTMINILFHSAPDMWTQAMQQLSPLHHIMSHAPYNVEFN